MEYHIVDLVCKLFNYQIPEFGTWATLPDGPVYALILHVLVTFNGFFNCEFVGRWRIGACLSSRKPTIDFSKCDYAR